MNQPRRLLSILILAFCLTVPLWGAEYTIDRVHSHVIFKVKHLGISTVTGRFDKFSGTFDFDPNNFKAGKVNATIEAASVNTQEERRDNHLRSPDFLDAAKFPTITFVSKEIKDFAEGKFKIVGDLTIHGVTKSVVLDAEYGGVAKQGENERSAFAASTTINRKDFGLNWSRTIETGGLVVANEIRISLDVEGIKKK